MSMDCESCKGTGFYCGQACCLAHECRHCNGTGRKPSPVGDFDGAGPVGATPSHASGATTGRVVINISGAWWREWTRAWSDIGRVHYARETETHIGFHEPIKWLGACQCFACRVMEAWSHRHDALYGKKWKVRR